MGGVTVGSEARQVECQSDQDILLTRTSWKAPPAGTERKTLPDFTSTAAPPTKHKPTFSQVTTIVHDTFHWLYNNHTDECVNGRVGGLRGWTPRVPDLLRPADCTDTG